MAFAATKLSLSLSLSPPLIRRGCYMAAAAACLSKSAVATSPPLLPVSPTRLCYMTGESIAGVEKEEKRRFTSSLLLPTYPCLCPNSPRNHYDLINNELSNSNQTIISEKQIEEEISSGTNYKQSNFEEIVAAEGKKKNNLVDEEILCRSSTTTSIDDSRRDCFRLFGIWLEKNNNNNNNNNVDETDKELMVLEEDCLKPMKKRKRAAIEAAAGDEEECCKLKLLPLKKRRELFYHVEDELMFKMRKVLTKCDVNNSSRLLLGNKRKISQLLSNMKLTGDVTYEQEIDIYDSDTQKETTLMLKRWQTMSYVLTTGWSKNFVKSRNLQKGDTIELQWDQTSKRLNFSVVYKAPIMAIPLASCSPVVADDAMWNI